MSDLVLDDERRLRELANGMAKDVEDTDKLLTRLGFTREDYNELVETRKFKAMLTEAASEWEGANNTRKRIELKAAINVEHALPDFYAAMINPNEPLSSRVKALEVVARIGKLGNPEVQAAGGGQFFKLEINLDGHRETLTMGAIPSSALSGDVSNTHISEESEGGYSQSKPSPLLMDLPRGEDL